METDNIYENIYECKELISLIQATPRVMTPADVTRKVMTRLSGEKETVQSFSIKRLFPTSLNFGFQASVTRKECAFYFLLAGFFYFILGLIMMIGLPLPTIITHNNGWLSFQPFFGLLLAAELALIGIIIYKKGDSALRFVRMGTLLYVAIVILNCWVGTLYIQIPAALFFIAVFSMTGLLFALLLGLSIEHYHSTTTFSEVSRCGEL